ncbi:MAG TPA: glycoside hydrolase family 172 protein [Armatimonadota bacterium]
MLDRIATLREGRSKRVSSYDTSGRNADAWVIEPHQTSTLADLKGAGVIRHIWFTVAADDTNYLRQAVLRMYWDGQDHPSVEVPVGDFFGVGHARATSYQCVALNMSANPGDQQHAAMNCYFPMPYASGARITIENQSDKRIPAWYFYVDYDELDAAQPDQGRFHAWWNRNNPCVPPTHQGDDPDVCLTDKDNYLLLEAEGRGHFVGCNLSIHNLYGGWWGEGDDMFMVDGEKWPPDLHGTGSEDYFNHAWGMQIDNSFLYNGVSYHAGTNMGFNERITVYRLHINEPVNFRQSLRVSIEHGHANDRCDDYSSTAYWYQTLPSKPLPPLPKMEDRLPREDVKVQPVNLPIPVKDRPRSGSPIDPSYPSG